MRKKICCSGLFATLGVILLILGVLVLVFFDPMVDKVIREELVLKNGTETYERWANPPIIPYLKVYFFNVTNVDQFMRQEEKPNLVEVGPYSYRENWKKVNVSFHENGTVSFEKVKHYYFDPSSSNGSESDIIHTINVPVVVAVDRVKRMNKFVKLAVSSMLQVLNETAFIQRNVSDLIWGYPDPLLDLGNRLFPVEKQVPFKEFGFFYQKNGSTDGRTSIYTGAGGMDNYTLIDTVNAHPYLPYWGTSDCNRINGSDGTSYPPGLTEESEIYLFNPDLCRSLPLKYSKSVEKDGINGYRYVPPSDVFADVALKEDNVCYCVGGPPCIGGGVFNISVCKFDTPTILSWPHFYEADAKYRDAVTGMKPDKDKHQLYIDLVPRTGFPLSAQARLQINFATTGVPEIKTVQNMTSMIFPVMWFQDGLQDLPQEVVDLLKLSSNVPEVTKRTLILCAFFIGGGMFIIALMTIFALRAKKTSKLPISHSSNGYSNPTMSQSHPDKLNERK